MGSRRIQCRPHLSRRPTDNSTSGLHFVLLRRTAAAAAASGSRVVSGSNYGGLSSPVERGGVTVVERGPSTSLTSWPTLQREAAACSPPPAAAGPTTVYVSGLGRQCTELWTWSVAAGWTRCGDLTTGRARHGACYVGGRVYAIGGVNRGATIGSVEYYDPV